MKNLTLHCDRKQHHPIEEKDRPKHRHVKYAEERHDKSNAECFNNRIPGKEKTVQGTPMISSIIKLLLPQ
jgi:hypothetical protein